MRCPLSLALQPREHFASRHLAADCTWLFVGFVSHLSARRAFACPGRGVHSNTRETSHFDLYGDHHFSTGARGKPICAAGLSLDERFDH